MVESIFWVSLFIVFYVYVGYPILTTILSFFFNRRVNKDFITPSVTVVIAAFNEEDVIETTIRNKLSQDYPGDRLEILVVSDASTDKTDEIVRNIDDSRVRFFRQEPRAGKTSALNMAVPNSKNDIIIFSDANSIYAPGTIRNLVQNFADPAVGYVSGKMIYANPDGTLIGEGCSTYMKYENMLRSFETRLGSIVGVDGGVDAVRKNLYQSMAPDQLPDFVLPLKVVAQGYRVVYEPTAELRETSLKGIEDEYRMRVRVSLRAMWALHDMRKLLGFTIHPLFSWQLWSHKVLRYLSFLFLLTLLVSNFLLYSKNSFFQFFLLIQTICYLGAMLSTNFERRGIKIQLINLFRYFVLLNLASAHAFIKYLSREKKVLWTPRKG